MKVSEKFIIKFILRLNVIWIEFYVVIIDYQKSFASCNSAVPCIISPCLQITDAIYERWKFAIPHLNNFYFTLLKCQGKKKYPVYGITYVAQR